MPTTQTILLFLAAALPLCLTPGPGMLYVLSRAAALFLLAFLPQFVDPSRGNPALQIVVLGLLFELMGSSVNLAVGASAGLAGNLLRAGSRGGRWMQRVSAMVFIGLGLRLALPDAAEERNGSGRCNIPP